MLEGMFSGNYKDIALLILRLALAIIMIVHGWQKIKNLPQAREQFSNMMVPMPLVTSFYAALVEFFGGFMLFVGFYSGWVAFAFAVDILGTMIFVTFKQGFMNGWERDFVLFIMALTILLGGPGAWAVILY